MDDEKILFSIFDECVCAYATKRVQKVQGRRVAKMLGYARCVRSPFYDNDEDRLGMRL